MKRRPLYGRQSGIGTSWAWRKAFATVSGGYGKRRDELTNVKQRRRNSYGSYFSDARHRDYNNQGDFRPWIRPDAPSSQPAPPRPQSPRPRAFSLREQPLEHPP